MPSVLYSRMRREKKWRTRDGRALELAEMTTLHVFNTRAYLQKKVEGATAQGLLRLWIDRFTEELDRRAALQLDPVLQHARGPAQ